ncbi:two-component system sensor histidine kinase YesM [Paenibacillus rhizosphaerae]|uniref:Two-component system sensor histidine kinase YesM n=1 Tax=Paenibacillus rhizosphaerae TaxID=297318 RepID=A0A839TP85_9BACL|nr:sensor histidine kinase [Paenibacillus rhizosphaerae]MBB3128626.1 two-component system sensor histidine kinase YesM [Paenibacillus rhizosphaerae]
MKRTMKSLSLRHKIIVMFLVLCIFLIGAGIYWYRMTTLTIQDNTMKLSRQIINQMNSRVDAYFMEIVNLTLPMTARNVSAQFLDKSSGGPYERLLYAKPVNQMIYNVMVGRPEIYGISVVSQDQVSTSSYSNLFAQERFSKISNKLDQPGKFVITGVENYNNIRLLTMAVKFFSPGTQHWGILIVDLKLDKISSIAKDVTLGDTGFIWIADTEGRYLYYPDSHKWSERIPEPFWKRLQSSGEGGGIEYSRGKKMIVTYGKSELTNLAFFSETPLAEVNNDLVKLRNTTILIGVTALMLGMMVAISVSFSLSRSILLLQRLMKRVEIGNLDVHAPDNKKGEIGYLYRSFNAMVNEIKNLIRTISALQVKEKELEIKQLDSRMQALQYQINPHFLYNTLEIVNSYAIIENIPVISRVVQSLARIFRYSVENHAKTIPLSEELAHIKDYLDIQMERFENLRVEILMDVNQSAKMMAVPMMLQPLMENAFRHGYQNHKLEPGSLVIQGHRLGDFFIIDVEDNGRGMAPELKDYYNRLFQDSGGEDRVEDARLGLWNVHSRIRLFFGHGCGLHILSSDASGTIIRITLPFYSIRDGSEALVHDHDC